MTGTVLLMTSCLNPGGMRYTKLQDVEERKKQYIEAIKYYIENTKLKIVFCDNSGADLSELYQFEGSNRIELLSFSGNDYDKTFGKGYGEFNIIKYAFGNSRFIKESSNTIKVTGRLMVCDLDEIKRLKDIMIAKRRRFVLASKDSRRKNCDSRCFFADNDFFIHFFLKQENKINDSEGYYFEHLLYDTIKDLPSDYVVSDFMMPLVINGVSGTSGCVYDANPMGYGDKLIEIRNFCEFKKQQYRGKDKRMFFRLSFISFMVRVKKAIFIRRGSH